MTWTRGCGIGCGSVVLLSVAGIIALRLLLGPTGPSYEEVTASFAAQQAEFETLRRMVQEDDVDCVPSGRTFRKYNYGLHYEGGVYDRGLCRRMPFGDRLAEYQRRMRSVNVGVVIQKSGDELRFVGYSAAYGAFMGFGGFEHGVIFSSTPPQATNDDITRWTITPVADGWYLFRKVIND